MAEQLYFSRDTRFFVQFRPIANNDETAGNLGTGSLWEIPILDGYSFSQTTNTSEITLSEMESTAGISRRGRRMFTDSLAPAEWSFSTYMRPFDSKYATLSSGVGYMRADTTGKVHSVEEVLWAHMFGADTYSSNTFTRSTNAVSGPVLTPATTSSSLVTTESNRSALHALTFYFLIETATDSPLLYRLPEAVVNEVSTDFDVDGIATLNWSGFAKEVQDRSDNILIADGSAAATPVLAYSVTRTNGDTAAKGDFWINTNNSRRVHIMSTIASGSGNHASTQAIDEAITSTSNFIRNRLTSVGIEAVDGADKAAAFPGNSIKISALDNTNKVFTTATPHGFKTGDRVYITGCAGNVVPNLTHLWVRVGDETSTYDGGTNATTEFALFESYAQAINLGNNGGLHSATYTGTYTANSGTVANGKYSLTLTGGNFTISNNITYLVPEELGAINKPLDAVTGTRTATASATCYLTLEDTAAATGNEGTSRQFFNDMVSTDAMSQTVNKFKLTMDIGGSAAAAADTTDPAVTVIFPQAHIEVPSHSIEDVISLETNISALPTSLGNADEIESIQFWPPLTY